jgi:hypothetical protein
MQFNAGLLLKIPNDVEEIARLRIAARAEHSDQTLRLSAGRPAEFLKAYGSLDVVPQDGLAGINVAGQHQIDTFAQEGIGKGAVLGDVLSHQFLETSCHRYGFASVYRENRVRFL